MEKLNIIDLATYVTKVDLLFSSNIRLKLQS